MLEDETDYANMFNFLPESLNLPDEREELVNRIQQSDHLWIIKVGAAKQKLYYKETILKITPSFKRYSKNQIRNIACYKMQSCRIIITDSAQKHLQLHKESSVTEW